MSQTSYALNTQLGKEGQIADFGKQNDLVSKVDIADAGGVPVGKMLIMDASGADRAKLPAASGDIAIALLAGIAVLSQTLESQLPAGSAAIWPKNYEIPVMRKGRVLVKPEVSVNVGDPVFIRYASGAGGTQVGAFRKDADTATAAAAPAGSAIWVSGTDATTGLATLEINL